MSAWYSPQNKIACYFTRIPKKVCELAPREVLIGFTQPSART